MKKRIWIIGSGPSLKDVDMDLFAGEDTFATNKINRIRSELNWNWTPTYYCKSDYNSIDVLSWKDEIRFAHSNCKHLWLWSAFKDGYPSNHANYLDMPDGVGNLDRVTWFDRCKHHHYQADNVKATQGWHKPYCTAHSSVSIMMQIAVGLEYDEIYLLGCDLGYTPDYQKNHAISDYTADERDKSDMDNANMLHIHKIAAQSSSVPIFNATPGGYLEVHPRANYKEVLNGSR